MHASICVCVCICVCACVSACMHVCMRRDCVCPSVYVFAYTHACVCECVRPSVYVCLLMFVEPIVLPCFLEFMVLSRRCILLPPLYTPACTHYNIRMYVRMWHTYVDVICLPSQWLNVDLSDCVSNLKLLIKSPKIKSFVQICIHLCRHLHLS